MTISRRIYLLILPVLALAVSHVSSAAEPEDFTRYGYYKVRRDQRMCPSPLCGGFWVNRVNRLQTRCADGTRARECYVAALRRMPSGGLERGSGKELLLQGRIRNHEFEGVGELGVFVVRRAWQAASTEASQGAWIGLENNATVCITSPCYSWDEHVLNRLVTRTASAIDLGGAGAPQELQDQAMQLIADGGVLIARGRNYQVEEANGIGLVFTATQFYLPLQ